jgi:hypothetical protein
MRAEFAILHGVLRMAYLLTALYVIYKTKSRGWPGVHQIVRKEFNLYVVLWVVLCYAVGEMLKTLEDVFVPYQQKPLNPLTQEEWQWRTAAALTYSAGIPGLVAVIRTVKKSNAPRQVTNEMGNNSTTFSR